MFGSLSHYADGMLCCPNCGAEAWVTEVHFNDGDVWYQPGCSCCNVSWNENYPTIEEAVKAWNGSRTVETKPVVHAKWIYFRGINGLKHCKCSECLTSDGCRDTPYCPYCGATMDLESEGKDE